ncbi:MAG: hypothetical protein KUG82_01770 [Pseudomonadales bacterium]|nr:hypothetical protein [Pseudomonadales bacterium]
MDIRSLTQTHENSIIVSPSLTHKKPTYLLKVRGNCMQEIGILDGDLIAVKKANPALTGDIVVTKLNDSSSINELKMLNGRYQLPQFHSTFDSVLLDSAELAVKGVFVGLVRGETCH